MSSLNRETGRDRYFAQRERELEELIDPATGLVAARFARHIACPVCGSQEHERLFVKNGFPIVRCRDCALVFANPQVDESLVLEEYRSGGSNDLWVDVLTSPRQLELDRAKFGEILDLLEPYRGEGRILDIGCSIGLFLHLAVERGWRGEGVEFGKRARRYAQQEFGLDVTDVPLEEAGYEPGSFDAVVLLSVLEHTTAPLDMLRRCATVLRPGGALYVIVPNVESLACRVLHERAATFDGRNHLVYFSAGTLQDALRRSGFRPQLVQTRVLSLDPVLEWLSYREPYSGDAPAGDVLADSVGEQLAEVERLFDRLQLGYKLHCLAVKAA